MPSTTTIGTVLQARQLQSETGTPQRAVSMKPKEHGAYAIVTLPMVAALAMSGMGIVSLAVVVASLAGFFAHEPMLIALGHRGQRAQRAATWARYRATSLILLCVGAGTTAMWFGSAAVQVSLAGCLLLAIVSFALSIARFHRTLGGQLLGVVSLSVPCLPILLAGEVSWQRTLLIWITWILGFLSTTLAVRGVIAAQKRQSRSVHWLGIGITTVSMIVLAFAGAWLPLATVPMIVASWLLLWQPPSAKHLRRVGWTLVSTTLLTGILLVIGNHF